MKVLFRKGQKLRKVEVRCLSIVYKTEQGLCTEVICAENTTQEQDFASLNSIISTVIVALEGRDGPGPANFAS